jgi:cholera toxin transcriptional activator
VIAESTSSRLIRFGQFEADLRTQELHRGTETQRLSGQPFQVLAMLLERAGEGEVVAREELRRQLWPADTVVDFEHGLNTCINRIRHVLADSAKHPPFVRPCPSNGYRFIASVQILV